MIINKIKGFLHMAEVLFIRFVSVHLPLKYEV
jgi:hypothetical protein